MNIHIKFVLNILYLSVLLSPFVYWHFANDIKKDEIRTVIRQHF